MIFTTCHLNNSELKEMRDVDLFNYLIKKMFFYESNAAIFKYKARMITTTSYLNDFSLDEERLLLVITNIKHAYAAVVKQQTGMITAAVYLDDSSFYKRRINLYTAKKFYSEYANAAIFKQKTCYIYFTSYFDDSTLSYMRNVELTYFIIPKKANATIFEQNNYMEMAESYLSDSTLSNISDIALTIFVITIYYTMPIVVQYTRVISSTNYLVSYLIFLNNAED
eukprot:Mrub_07160.p3 GENE.Mrub_07160~~Mrub_07160.p3  ORF type:complete len:224 (-),score=12.96 Mrub_07160:79-750(-)